MPATIQPAPCTSVLLQVAAGIKGLLGFFPMTSSQCHQLHHKHPVVTEGWSTFLLTPKHNLNSTKPIHPCFAAPLIPTKSSASRRVAPGTTKVTHSPLPCCCLTPVLLNSPPLNTESCSSDDESLVSEHSDGSDSAGSGGGSGARAAPLGDWPAMSLRERKNRWENCERFRVGGMEAENRLSFSFLIYSFYLERDAALWKLSPPPPMSTSGGDGTAWKKTLILRRRTGGQRGMTTMILKR